MPKRIARLSPAFALAALLAACAANDMGMEFAEIAEENSKLIFYGPGLDGGFRRFLTAQTPRYDKITVGIYGPRRGGFPRAVIRLDEGAPGRHFPTAAALSRYVAATEFFKGRKITPGGEDETRNAAGRIRYLTFLADAMPCIAFKQFMGTLDDGGLGTKRLSRYYCKGEGEPIAAGEAVEIVKALGHRDHGAPEPPPGWGT